MQGSISNYVVRELHSGPETQLYMAFVCPRVQGKVKKRKHVFRASLRSLRALINVGDCSWTMWSSL